MRFHPHDLLLQEYAAAFPEDREECLEHLLECPECRNRLRLLLHSEANDPAAKVVPLVPQVSLVKYDPGLARISKRLCRIQSAYAKERAEAHGLFSELSQHPHEKRPLIVRNSPRFHTWGFCELLLRHGWEETFREAVAGEGLALLALEVLDCLDPGYYGGEALEDLRARAWAYVANSRRVKADLRGSEEAFALAFASLKRGTQDPMDRGVLLDLRASLLRAQRRFGIALGVLRRAARIFADLGEKNLAGQVLVKVATVHIIGGEPEKAIPVLYRALALIDSAREPRLLLSAWHNLVFSLAELGRFMEAQKLLARTRPLYRQFTQPSIQNRLKWMEGKIVLGLGQRDQGESLLLGARDGFLEQGFPYETALVSLELASLYAEQGRLDELKSIAEEMMPVFASRRIHREALAALVFWRKAVESEKAGCELVSGVASFLKRAQHDPDLRFERPKGE